MGNPWATYPGSPPRTSPSASSRASPSVSVTLGVIEQSQRSLRAVARATLEPWSRAHERSPGAGRRLEPGAWGLRRAQSRAGERRARQGGGGGGGGGGFGFVFGRSVFGSIGDMMRAPAALLVSRSRHHRHGESEKRYGILRARSQGGTVGFGVR